MAIAGQGSRLQTPIAPSLTLVPPTCEIHPPDPEVRNSPTRRPIARSPLFMVRLSRRALDLLLAELDRASEADPLGSVYRSLLESHLKQLHATPGEPLSEAELLREVREIHPDFDPVVVQRAARANGRRGRGQRSQAPSQPSRLSLPKLSWVRNGAIAAAIAVGGIWVLNLPYPMIRFPVARTAPILLLPSFITMDRDYRQVISLVEQADQLINQATSFADIELGAEKVSAAQAALDRLPVWFLGYYPQTYCTLMGCTWRFTVDEFAAARANVGRMEVQVLQETNAWEQFTTALQTVEASQAAHQAATTTAARSTALETWQQGLDQLRAVPPATLGGRQAQLRLIALDRDFQQETGTLAGTVRAGGLIEAAQGFAYQAALLSQNPPHPAATWQRAADLWGEAIRRLEQLPPEDPAYGEAQQLLVTYLNNQGQIRQRLAEEETAQQNWLRAQDAYTQLVAIGANLDSARHQAKVQEILNFLQRIPSNTTPATEAATMRQALEPFQPNP